MYEVLDTHGDQQKHSYVCICVRCVTYGIADIGQVEGAIVMGLGYFTSEEVLYDRATGANLSYGTWKYKPPMANDIPVDLRVELLHDAPNPSGVLRSKRKRKVNWCVMSIMQCDTK